MATKKQINAFLSDPAYLALVDLEQEHRLLFITAMTETRLSSVLAWLFHPQEGHGLGDRAFRQLLLTVWRNNPDDCPMPTPSEMGAMSFRDLLVNSEYAIKDGRIDLLLVSRQSRLVVAIENKFGSKTHGDQLPRYKKYISNKFDTYQQVYIYLDRYWDKETQKSPDLNWIGCDYEWLLALIKAQQAAGVLSMKALDTLTQVGEYLNPDSEEFIRQTQKKAHLISEVVVNHSEVLTQIRKLKLAPSWREAIESNIITINEPLLVELNQRWHLWMDVLNQAHHAQTIAVVKATFGDDLEVDVSPVEVFFRLNSWKRFDKNDADYWGPRVCAYLGKNDDESPKNSYTVTAGMRLNDVREDVEPELRKAVLKLRNSSMRAAAKSAQWIVLFKEQDVRTTNVAQLVIDQLQTMKTEFQKIN